MATTLDPREPAIVNYDEPPIKPPPLLSVGPLAWIRTNLFKTTFDTILTIISGIILVTVVSAVLQWAIGSANWFVVTANFRLFMAGTFPLESLWRLEWAARLCAFVIGFTIVAYTRASRSLLIFLVIVLVLLFAAPPLINATIPPVTTYVAVGETPIVSGSVTETPQNQVGFVAREGETITVRANAAADADTPLAQTAGFTDRASAALINAAANRLNAIQTRIDLENRLEHGLLTDEQQVSLTNELDGMQIPDPVTETYQINETSVAVTIIDGATLEPLTRATLTVDSEPLTYTLPADGWYILQKTSEGTALLATTGIYPINEQGFTRAQPSGGSISITQYVRMTDGYTTEALRPRIDGQNVPELVITDNQYQGVRPLGDYLKVFIAPFFRDLSVPVLQLVVMGVLGYLSAYGLARVLPAKSNDRGDHRLRVRGATTWLWLLWLIALFVLSYGVDHLDAVGVGILISRFVWVVWMYFTGMNLDRAWGRPLLALVTLLGIAQTVIAESLFDKISSAFSGADAAILVMPLVSLAIWLIVGLYAARMGRSGRSGWDDSTRLRALIVTAALWLILFIAPPLLLTTSTNADNLLPVVDTRRWGGFLLTMMLTIVAIIASFPLGVLLALGRRSSLPVVKATCIIYIELVRGVPLITVLFMAQLLVPLVNPSLAEVDNVFRAMVGLTLFSAAYLAENVRGGLQAIAHGQEEAAKALGLNGYQVTLLILLPQALRIVIPALVGQAIALFKDTSLVALVGLIDLTGMAQSVVAQAEFIGLQKEVYLFISVLYFIFSYLMAWVSRRIESSGSGAARRV